MERAYLNWSGGKDATLALYHTIKKGILSVEALFTVLRKYRKKKCNEAGMTALFPLWGMSSRDTLTEFIQVGFKANNTSEHDHQKDILK